MIKLVEIIALREALAIVRRDATGRKLNILWDATDALCSACEHALRGNQVMVRVWVGVALNAIKLAKHV